jgi:hypothetical protein
MADVLTTISKIINSPPGQLVAGGVLAGIVWKFFERVEAVLTDQTKLEISVWLLGVKVGRKVEPWPDTFANVFDRVFGKRHFSVACLKKSTIATFLVATIAWIYVYFMSGEWRVLDPGPSLTDAAEIGLVKMIVVLVAIAIVNVFPDYISLLETRYALRLTRRVSNSVGIAVVLVADLIVTAAIPGLPLYYFERIEAESAYSDIRIIATLSEPEFLRIRKLLRADLPEKYKELIVIAIDAQRQGRTQDAQRAVHRMKWEIAYRMYATVAVYPAFFTSIWLWLYAGSGFILKAARRFDLGFEWFNQKFDIEKKPLQSIGLVAGALVAIVYWAAVIVIRAVG